MRIERATKRPVERRAAADDHLGVRRAGVELDVALAREARLASPGRTTGWRRVAADAASDVNRGRDGHRVAHARAAVDEDRDWAPGS